MYNNIISIRIQDEIVLRIREMSNDEKITLSNFVRKAITQKLSKMTRLTDSGKIFLDVENTGGEKGG